MLIRLMFSESFSSSRSITMKINEVVA